MSDLAQYKNKRNFAKTPEPTPDRVHRNKSPRKKKPRFVIQKHDARRLHYDFRLENKEGFLKSWAVPKGISINPSVKRLAIMTEDHPWNYITFEGDIPEGNYGAGRVTIWDSGTYQSDGDLDDQIETGRIKIRLFGKKVRGSFFLIKTKNAENHWLLVKSTDEYSSTSQDIVEQPLQSPMSDTMTQKSTPSSVIKGWKKAKNLGRAGSPRDFPSAVKPMLATAVDGPFDKKDWVYEVKWDGVRAILFRNKADRITRISSRKGNEITARYPELTDSMDSKVRFNNSVVLDGEIVVLNANGLPDFQRHQSRMNVDDEREIARLSAAYPAEYFVFDILYLDGLDLEQLDFIERRKILATVIRSDGSKNIRISDYFEDDGKKVFKSAISMGLEGIVAKYKFSRYEEGSRSSTWLKVKGVLTQDCAVIGYTTGEGNRKDLFGSLILAANIEGKLRFIGHTGSGFAFDQLYDTLDSMKPLITSKCPIDYVPYVNRKPVWLRPELVVEVKFHNWTQDGIMRAPIFVRFREDKTPNECIIEKAKDTDLVTERVEASLNVGESGKAVTEQSFSNMQKTYWPVSSSNAQPLTKQDLIYYYDNISRFILPHLKDRPLSLSRYPDGIWGKSFFHKNWTQDKPDFVAHIKLYSESTKRVINYLMCNNAESLLWLANLGCIEMHPWYSRVHSNSACNEVARDFAIGTEVVVDETSCGLDMPDFIIFDLDPYIYSGKERFGDEPQYNTDAFKTTVEIALMLNDFLKSLNLRSYVKTSGKTGLHVFVPIANNCTYDQTRAFAETVGKIMMTKAKEKLTMEWGTTSRRGKVFFDFKQNAFGKTVASAFSVRPTESATVSMPVKWNKLHQVTQSDFTMLTVPEWLRRHGDAWAGIIKDRQDLKRVLYGISEA